MAEKNKFISTAFDILKIQSIICFFSIISVLSKYASTFEFLSFQFMIIYGIILMSFMIYAFFWQKLLMKNSLFKVYSNRALLVVYTLVWGVLLFNETVTVYNILGVVLIVSGIIVVFNDDK